MLLSRKNRQLAVVVTLLGAFAIFPPFPPEALAVNIIWAVLELNQSIHPINGSSPDLDEADMAVFSDLGDVKILGLGEATHGTKEFFEMKHRIFRYFVNTHGTRIFGFECDFAESIYLDRYVTTGQGDLKSLMSSKMHFWTWHTEEVMALLEWMRVYNEGRAEDEKIHYFGFDCQSTDLHIPLLREYILRFLPEIPAAVEAVLGEIQALTVADYQAMEPARRDLLIAKLGTVDDLFAVWETEARAALGGLDFELARRLVRTATQGIEVRYVAYTNDGISPRDKYMAENALWLQELLSSDGPLLAWAHNGHVSTDSEYGGLGSMGSFLRNKLGLDYRVVGFSFCTGSFMAVGTNGLRVQTITEKAPKYSYNGLFHMTTKRNFILRLDQLEPQGFLMSWMGEPRLFLHIGAAYYGNYYDYIYTVDLLKYYDAVIHFDKTTAAVQLNRN